MKNQALTSVKDRGGNKKVRKKCEPQISFSDLSFINFDKIFPADEELEKMSAALDETPAILDEAARDLHCGVQGVGVEGMTVEQVLRSAIIYQLKEYSYRELAARIADSYNYRKFTRFHADTIPHFTNFEKAIKKIRPETFEKINDLLVQHAIKKKLENGKIVRSDGAVVETNIHYPTDASLLWDSVRVLDRLMQGVIENCPSANFQYHDRTRGAKKYCYAITMAKGNGAQGKRERIYRKLLKASREVMGMAESCVKSLVSDSFGFEESLWASLFKEELARYIGLAARAVEQCERRILRDEKVPADEKIVSIFEEHTDIICRGKTMSPAEFGHKILVTTGASGIVTQYKICSGNPGDNELVQAILEKHVAQFGAAPRCFAGDRRFWSAANEELAYGAPYNVEHVSIPRPGYRNSERRSVEKETWFKKLQRFRAGIEGCLSTLLRSFGLTRCLWEGWESFKSWVGLSIFAYNLRKIAAMT